MIAIINRDRFLNSISRLVCVMDMHFVFRDVGNKFLNAAILVCRRFIGFEELDNKSLN
jgi:hypothetical protein